MDRPNEHQAKPKAVLWLESSLTSLHIKHMAQVSRALEAKGFEVSILTSEDTIKQFEKSGGKLSEDGTCAPGSAIDFGKHAHVLPAMASQTSFRQPGVVQFSDSQLTPFEFIESRPIVAKRKEAIAKAIGEVKPDVLVTSLWPSGYGPFTKEITGMIEEAKKQKPDVAVYSLSNDIPYMDYYHNRASFKGPLFDIPNATFVRGDGSIRMSSFVPLSRAAEKKIDYVGHFVEPLPPRRDMPEKERKVLVTFGTRESEWRGDNYQDYFNSAINIAGLTKLRDHPWELVVGPHCPDHEFEAIKRYAVRVGQRDGVKFEVRRGMPDKDFRQDLADAAFRIAQYDIQVLDDVQTGIPALITTGNIARWSCGAQDGDQRLLGLEQVGAPVRGERAYNMRYVADMARLVNEAYDQSKQRAYSIPQDGPDKVAAAIASRYEEAARKRKVKPDVLPDPVLGELGQATQQTDEKNRSNNRRSGGAGG